MKSIKTTIEMILREMQTVLSDLDLQSIEAAIQRLENAKRIFLAGAGRSGLIMRCFDIRLMHLGKTVYMVGEPGTPSIQSDDLLVIGSGSGRTGSLVLFAEGAKKIGAEVLLFTIDPQSTLGRLADDIVQIPAPSPKIGDLADQHSSGQPMGNLFEQCLFALQDVLTIELMKRIGLTEKEMFARHANLE